MTGDQVNIGQMTGSNFVKGDVFGNVTSTSYGTAQKQSLAEAAAEIQRLLKQLEETNPTDSVITYVLTSGAVKRGCSNSMYYPIY